MRSITRLNLASARTSRFRVDAVTARKLRAEAGRRDEGVGEVIDELAKTLPGAEE
jgi:hypothetical protein